MKVGLLGKGLNSRNWLPLETMLVGNEIEYEKLSNYSDISADHSVVFSIGLNHIIPKEFLNIPAFGVIVFHSSDLPRGRGWAPLFYTIVNKEKHLTQSMIYAEPRVDSGPIIAKAKYPINEFYTIGDLRQIDDCLTIILFSKYANIVCRKKVNATEQNHEDATYWEKRTPSNSKINEKYSFIELYDKIRALPDHIPAFLEKNGVKIEVRLDIKNEIQFDPKLVIIKDYVMK